MTDRFALLGCGWCLLRVQGCRCTAPCGAGHCSAEINNRTPAVHDHRRMP